MKFSYRQNRTADTNDDGRTGWLSEVAWWMDSHVYGSGGYFVGIGLGSGRMLYTCRLMVESMDS